MIRLLTLSFGFIILKKDSFNWLIIRNNKKYCKKFEISKKIVNKFKQYFKPIQTIFIKNEFKFFFINAS
jgi:hypothetical protein